MLRDAGAGLFEREIDEDWSEERHSVDDIDDYVNTVDNMTNHGAFDIPDCKLPNLINIKKKFYLTRK